MFFEKAGKGTSREMHPIAGFLQQTSERIGWNPLKSNLISVAETQSLSSGENSTSATSGARSLAMIGIILLGIPSPPILWMVAKSCTSWFLWFISLQSHYCPVFQSCLTLANCCRISQPSTVWNTTNGSPMCSPTAGSMATSGPRTWYGCTTAVGAEEKAGGRGLTLRCLWERRGVNGNSQGMPLDNLT